MLNNVCIYMYIWINLQGLDAERYVWNFAERSKLYCIRKTIDGSCQEKLPGERQRPNCSSNIEIIQTLLMFFKFFFKKGIVLSDVSPVHMNSAHINFNINNNYLSKYIHKETCPVHVWKDSSSHCRSWEEKIKYKDN